MKLKNVSRTALSLLLLTAPAWAQTQSPVGTWETVDDKTGSPRALIEITQDQSGVLSGKVVKGLIPGEPTDKRCTACTDERKDKVIIGMTVLRGMHQEGDDWEGGDILDPDNGKVYRCKMHLEKGGTVLVVRGFIGFSLLGRSQSWVRPADISAPASH
jgi:uncharacterized protein (DUF2147 family)